MVSKSHLTYAVSQTHHQLHVVSITHIRLVMQVC
jgi:hypothetical protein